MKNWMKPEVTEVSAKMISTYIQIAARSSVCISGFGR